MSPLERIPSRFAESASAEGGKGLKLNLEVDGPALILEENFSKPDLRMRAQPENDPSKTVQFLFLNALALKSDGFGAARVNQQTERVRGG